MATVKVCCFADWADVYQAEGSFIGGLKWYQIVGKLDPFATIKNKREELYLSDGEI